MLKRSKAGWTVLLQRVFQRDRGVCERCGLDTEAARKQYEALQFKGKTFEAAKFADGLHIPHNRRNQKWWDGHHLIAVVDGGKDDLSNIQTVCLGCHRPETTRTVKVLAKTERIHKKFGPPKGFEPQEADA